MERVVVTGATGFLGGHMTRALLTAGQGVLALGRDPGGLAALAGAGAETLSHDLTRPLDPGALGRVDAVVHCAALSSAYGPRRAFEAANVAATRHVLDAALEAGVRRFVHISSPTVYFRMADALGVSEDLPLPPPINAYAATKRVAEDLVRAAPEVGPVILRPRGIYGPGDTTLVPSLMAAARARPLPRLRGGVAEIDLTYVGDVVDAVLCALGADTAGETLNISGGEVIAVREIVEATCAATGTPVAWRDMPLGPTLIAARLFEGASALIPALPPPLATRYTLGLFAFRQSLDISRAERVMGWVPKVRFAEGLAKTFEAGA